MAEFFIWHGATILLWGVYWAFLCLLLCLEGLRQAPRQVGLAALVCALRAGTAVVLPWHVWAGLLGWAPPAAWVNPLYHHVDATQEVLALLLLAAVVYGLKWVTPAEAGLRAPRPGAGRPVALVVAAVAVGTVASAYATRQNFPAQWWNERLFLLTLPGLAEELFYRGVLLGLLGQVFARRLWLLGTRTSWGGVVGVVLFALAHGLRVPANQLAAVQAGGPHTSWHEWYRLLPLWHGAAADQLYYLAMGTLLLWVRERTGSVWAAAGTHCLLNASLLLGSGLG